MVVKSNSCKHIYHVLHGLITSSDDTAIFMFRGAAASVQGWYLLCNTNTGKKQSRFCNETGGIDHLNGIRVQLTFTMSALGYISDPFITVTGITE